MKGQLHLQVEYGLEVLDFGTTRSMGLCDAIVGGSLNAESRCRQAP